MLGMSKPPLQADRYQHKVDLPAEWPPTLVVVVDTEEEFDWTAPFDSTSRGTTNILFQPLAQEIMDRHGVVPTYVIDYPVVDSPDAVSILRSIADEGRCEIGAHLHPWVSPPIEEQVNVHNSFPGNLPPSLEREKLARLAERIEKAFSCRPIVYKAGRYGVGPNTFQTLRQLGFRVDTSVVPHTDFSASGGSNFKTFPSGPFLAGGDLVALPLSVHFTGALAAAGPKLYPSLAAAAQLRLPGLAARLGLLERLRLSPEGHNVNDLKRQTRAALARGERYFMLTYHSSTLLPGATPYARHEIERDAFLNTLDTYFKFFSRECSGTFKRVIDVAKSIGKFDV
jgi:hypothetical protein